MKRRPHRSRGRRGALGLGLTRDGEEPAGQSCGERREGAGWGGTPGSRWSWELNQRAKRLLHHHLPLVPSAWRCTH